MNNCPVCGSEDLVPLKRYSFKLDRHPEKAGAQVTYEQERLTVFFQEIWTGGPEARIDIDRCGSCGMLFSNPRFTAGEIRRKYEVLDKMGSVTNRHRENPASRTDERAGRIYSLIRDTLGRSPRGLRVLDYGGAQGYNLLPFLPENQCLLLDYVAHEYPEGIVRLGNDIEDLDAAEKFDVILACHVLEHAVDPSGLARSLAAHLSDRGLLYVEVPLGVLREWKKLREPLTHVNFFSEESIYNCVRNAGMEVLRLWTAYQWVTHSETWNVLLIAGSGASFRRTGGTGPTYKSTRRQMSNPLYYIPPLIRRVRRMAGKQD